MMRRFLFVAATVLLGGCAVHPSVLRVADLPKEGEVFEGVPMRLKAEQIVEVWRLDPEKAVYKQVFVTRQMMADQTRLYAMDVKTGPFASPGLRVQLYADNTPKSIQVASSLNAAGAVDAATSAMTTATTLRNGQVSARNADATACQTARAQVIVANTAVQAAQKAYDDNKSAASPELRDAYQQAITDAKLAADFARDNPQC